MNIDELRNRLCQQGLSRGMLKDDPLELFSEWFDLVKTTDMREPDAMVLSTIENDTPWQRTVLLKHYDRQGFVFYTNYESRKAQQLTNNKEVCLLFPWYALQRQIIIKGKVEKTHNEMSLKYFQSRSRGSQIGAWASKQSQEMQQREELLQRVNDTEAEFKGQEALPLPPFWGGYQVKAYRYEFWQGRQDRLHDRFVYDAKQCGWMISRLYP